jgi:hypothetical protein
LVAAIAAQRPPEVTELINALAEADLLEFADDCVKHLRGMQVPFLSKYRDRFGGHSHWIAASRDYIIELFQLALRHTSSTSMLDGYKSILGDVPEALHVVIFSRRQELARCLT